MEKRKKNLNWQSKQDIRNKKKKKYFKKSLNRKRLEIIKKHQKIKFLFSRLKFQITVRMSQNNVFCHFKDLIKKKSLFVMSAGKCNVKISKKNLRFNNKFIFKKFIKKIKPFIKKKTFFLKILAPIKIRKKLLKSLKGFLKQRSVIIKVKAHKCFNGCRPKKAKRKKQKKWVVYK